MASACVNSIGISSMDCPPPPPSPPNNFASFSWLTPINISCNHPPPPPPPYDSLNPVHEEDESGSSSNSDSDPTTTVTEFEFQLEGAHVRMLPADELFSDGKLVPLQQQLQRPPEEVTTTPKEIRLRNEQGPGPGPINDPSGYFFSPRAPTCSSRWKELLGFKRFYQNTNKPTPSSSASASASASAAAHKSLKSFLHRNQKSSVSPHVDSSSLTLPLIQQDASRLSLSSSCSSSGGHDHDDFPRLSLDSEKPNFRRYHHHRSRQLQGVVVSKEKSLLSSLENPHRSSLRKDVELISSADSPRMNSSGKIVFHHSLERSSSSPSTLNGGPRYKYRGMERSYSANVRYTPVLNVPVCSSLRGSSSSSAGVFGFPLFSPSQQKKDGSGGASSTASGDAVKGNRKIRSDRA